MRAAPNPRLLGLGLLLLAGAGVGCGQKGRVFFLVDSPADARLDPFRDPRRDFVTIADVNDPQNPVPLGRIVGTNETSGFKQIGDLAVGTYDVQAQVLGGGQIIGMARQPAVEVLSLKDTNAILSVRKPLAFYLSQKVLNPGALVPEEFAPWPFPPLHALDPTLEPLDPTVPAVSPLARFNLPGCKDKKQQEEPGGEWAPPTCSTAGVSATTADGKLVLVALPGRLVVLDSGRLFEADSPQRIPAMVSLLKVPTEQAAPNPRSVRVTRDGTHVAVATDQGLSVGELPAILAGTVTELPTIPFPDDTNKLRRPTAIAFTLDEAAVTVLTGPTLVPGPTPGVTELNCGAKQPAFTYLVSLDGVPRAPEPAPDNATDVAWAPRNMDREERLLFAAPCGGGVVTADGTVEIPGRKVGQVLVAGGRVFAVDGKIQTDVSSDPQQPEIYSAAMISFAASPKSPATVRFQVPPSRVQFKPSLPGMQPVLLSLAPTEVTVYAMAATPDVSRVLLADRTTYRASGATYKFNTVTDNKGNLVSQCSLQATRDVYHLTEIDAGKNGAPLFQRVVGVDDSVTACTISCTLFAERKTVDTACASTGGFIPYGLSLAFGSY